MLQTDRQAAERKKIRIKRCQCANRKGDKEPNPQTQNDKNRDGNKWESRQIQTVDLDLQRKRYRLIEGEKKVQTYTEREKSID